MHLPLLEAVRIFSGWADHPHVVHLVAATDEHLPVLKVGSYELDRLFGRQHELLRDGVGLQRGEQRGRRRCGVVEVEGCVTVLMLLMMMLLWGRWHRQFKLKRTFT